MGRLTIMVRADQRGRGVGTALLAKLMSEAEERLGLTGIELDVFADNGPALRIYRHFGFEVETRHIGAEGREILTMVRATQPKKSCEPKDGRLTASSAHMMDHKRSVLDVSA